jgi:hypothetical protein
MFNTVTGAKVYTQQAHNAKVPFTGVAQRCIGAMLERDCDA